MACEWYCRMDGAIRGPMSTAELKRLAQAGRIATSTVVKKGAQGKWLRATSVKGLLNPTMDSTSHRLRRPTESAESSGNDNGPAVTSSFEQRTTFATKGIHDSQEQCSAPARNTSQGYLQTDEELPPPAAPLADDERAYIDVLHRSGQIERFTEISLLRKALLAGRIDRHYLARWVAPALDIARIRTEYLKQQQQVGQSPSESDQERHLNKAKRNWEKRRHWRPIGTSLVREEPSLSLLYHPVEQCTSYGLLIGAVALPVAVGIIVWACAMTDYLLMAGEHAISHGSLGRGLIPGFLCSAWTGLKMAVVVWCVTAPIGTGLGRIVGCFLPRPPCDGFEENGPPVATRNRTSKRSKQVQRPHTKR